jgi:hypothetical protein
MHLEADVLGCLEGELSDCRQHVRSRAIKLGAGANKMVNNAARAHIRSLTTYVVRFTRDAHCSECLLVTTSLHIGGC